MKDNLGERLKENYENRTRYYLPRRSYVILRIDGKAFHSFTKRCDRPFDQDLINLMNNTAISLCENIQGAKFAYVQSDEISLLLTDFENIHTSAWFENNIQKMTSISASIATAYFNSMLNKSPLEKFLNKSKEINLALFDSRVFTVPDVYEVENYFIWRQNDASRNSIQLAAQALYSPKQLHGKNTSVLQEMIFQKGINWNDYPVRCKRGGFVVKEHYLKDTAVRTRWINLDPPIFTQERSFLRGFIPLQENWKKE